MRKKGEENENGFWWLGVGVRECKKIMNHSL
jgi:hypothetical protein